MKCAMSSIAIVLLKKTPIQWAIKANDSCYGASDKCQHNKHDSSGFIRDGLNVNNISVCEEEKQTSHPNIIFQ